MLGHLHGGSMDRNFSPEMGQSGEADRRSRVLQVAPQIKISAVKVFKWTGDLPQNVNYAVKVGYVRALLSSVDSVSNVRVLSVKRDDLAGLAKRIGGSVLMVIAQ